MMHSTLTVFVLVAAAMSHRCCSAFSSHPSTLNRKTSPSSLSMSAPPWSPEFHENDPDLSSPDPFRILGLHKNTVNELSYYTTEVTPTKLDMKQIKDAYHRLANKYHPDHVSVIDAGKEEVGETVESLKKEASEAFQKIHWAYEVLTGKAPPKDMQPKTTSMTNRAADFKATKPPTWGRSRPRRPDVVDHLQPFSTTHRDSSTTDRAASFKATKPPTWGSLRPRRSDVVDHIRPY